MSKRLFLTTAIACMAAFGSQTGLAAADDFSAPHAADQLIVGFNSGATNLQERATVTSQDAKIEQRLPLVEGAVVSVAPDQSLKSAAANLERTGAVDYAQPNYVRKSFGEPNDPFFGSLWGMTQIAAPEAWQAGQGTRNVTVAVLDSGIDTSHPDLAANLWTNPGEIPGNGRDDDGDGVVDDVNGVNYVDQSGTVYDDNGHGTHVSGTIGANGNNGIGVAGVNWNVSTMALKFLDDQGSGLDSDAITAINYATDHGARVINASWGGPEGGMALEQAIRRAGDRGVLFVTAAGNDGANNDTTDSYPANFDEPNIVSVAASTREDELASFSNYGPRSVDLAAPGANIVSTVPGDDYASASGTSMAAPHVAGAAALLLSVDGGLSVDALKSALLNSVDRLPAYANSTISGGRLNVAQALRAVGAGVPPLDDGSGSNPGPSPFRLIRPTSNTVVRSSRVHFTWQRSRSKVGIASYKVVVDGRVAKTVKDPDGSGIRSAANSVILKLHAGQHSWHVVAVDAAGKKRTSNKVSLKQRKGHSKTRGASRKSQPFVVKPGKRS